MKRMNAKRKRILIAVLVVALALSLSIGSALAYYNSVTEEKSNVFTSAENIRAKLIEPNWDAQEGLKLVPGKTVPKDPMVVNTGEIDEYVAIRLTFLDASGNPLPDAKLEKLLSLVDITWNSQWKADPAQPMLFYYQSILSPGQTSDPLFSSIRCHDESDGLTEEELRWLQGIKIVDGIIVPDSDGIGYFSIKVEGAAIQAFGLADAAAAESELAALFPAI